MERHFPEQYSSDVLKVLKTIAIGTPIVMGSSADPKIMYSADYDLSKLKEELNLPESFALCLRNEWYVKSEFLDAERKLKKLKEERIDVPFNLETQTAQNQEGLQDRIAEEIQEQGNRKGNIVYLSRKEKEVISSFEIDEATAGKYLELIIMGRLIRGIHSEDVVSKVEMLNKLTQKERTYLTKVVTDARELLDNYNTLHEFYISGGKTKFEERFIFDPSRKFAKWLNYESGD